MFADVHKSLPARMAFLVAVSVISTTGSAIAKDAPAGATIPVTVDLSEVQALDGPLYISIQTEADYRTMRGHGGILKPLSGLPSEVTYKVPMPGRYAVSVWHDLDGDEAFSMDESFRPTDGWGASGKIDPTRNPSFDDVAVTVPSYGANVDVRMFYPAK